ncbi:uncharacterized protein LOC110606300 isoform X4 [Manihot esculenta]|nr:uncharacterized protein LOC110606300 isoform X4 [Manihot esculenta]XP_043810926.1 uncharacterized protein LOC110606300 isoform X4 [Manihot esculenta]KAG8661886.1 hypothetical protein MANES_01G045650v8 [Manihot esculenta]KAG8661889.1 hypothetical protein MANES_01G045650v8 [Manihot esculenta]
MMSKNEEVEFVERRTSGRCKSEELVDLEQKGPGYCHRADENGIGDESTHGSERPLLVDIVEIIDSDDDSSPCEILGAKVMPMAPQVHNAHSAQEISELGTEVLKRKLLSSVKAGGNDNNQDIVDSCTGGKLKMTKSEKIIHKLNSSPAMDSSVANSGREFSPSMPTVLLQGEENIGVDSESQNGSDSSSSSGSEDEWDFSVDFSSMIKNWQQGRVHGARKRGELATDMVTTFKKDGELCMEVVCSLDRQKTSVRKLIYGTSATEYQDHNKLAVTSSTQGVRWDEPNDQGDMSAQIEHEVPSPSTARSSPALVGSSPSALPHALLPSVALTSGSAPLSSFVSAGTSSIPPIGGAPTSFSPTSSVDAISLTRSHVRTPIKLVNNALHPSDVCARKITSIFKIRLDKDGYCWKSVSKETKDLYWEEFQKHFIWDETNSSLIKIAWQRKAAERYRSLMCSFRKGKEKSMHVPDITWQKWNEAWSTEDFKSRSKQFSANRRSETGGPGSGISRHSGGSISHTAHAERLRKSLGREPLPYELFKVTHTRKGTSDLVDARAQSIKDAFLALKNHSSQPQEGCSEPPIVDEVMLYYQAVGGNKKRRVYGVGSQASTFYSQSFHTSFSSTTSRVQSEALRDELRQLHQTVDVLQQGNQKLRQSLAAMEERNQQCEQLMEKREKQREELIQECLHRMQEMMKMETKFSHISHSTALDHDTTLEDGTGNGDVSLDEH